MISQSPNTITFELYGGPHDGLVVRDVIGSAEWGPCDGLLCRTEGGKPGAGLWMPTPYALDFLQEFGIEGFEYFSAAGYRFPGHLYQVISRELQGSILIIRVKHMGVSEQ